MRVALVARTPASVSQNVWMNISSDYAVASSTIGTRRIVPYYGMVFIWGGTDEVLVFFPPLFPKIIVANAIITKYMRSRALSWGCLVPHSFQCCCFCPLVVVWFLVMSHLLIPIVPPPALLSLCNYFSSTGGWQQQQHHRGWVHGRAPCLELRCFLLYRGLQRRWVQH